MADDKLKRMFDRQFYLETKVYSNDLPDMTQKERLEYIRWNVLAVEDEVHEALGETGWKPWTTSDHINRDAYCNEIIDTWHFLMNLALVVGMTEEEFFTRYMAKTDLNAKRQNEGYDGLNKCPKCKRALDDSAVKCWYVGYEGDEKRAAGFCETFGEWNDGK